MQSVQKSLVLLFLLLLPLIAFDASAQKLYEIPDTQVVPIQDPQGGQYELYIKLPEGYSENTETQYPAIYFTDAVWHLEMLSAATEYMLEDVILVGISWRKDISEDLNRKYGEHASRFTDYSFWNKPNPKHPKLIFGKAENHLAFIRNDVIHYVDSNFRTDPDSRTYFGYSLSGTFGAYILLTQADTFDNYILGSPLSDSTISYLTELNAQFETFGSDRGHTLRANVFIAHGTLEEDKPKPIDEFMRLLNNSNHLGFSIHKKTIEGDHHTAFPPITLSAVAWLSTLIREVTHSEPEILLNSSSSRAFLNIPQLNKAFINPKPEDRSDGIVVGELGVDGGNKNMVVKLAQEIADHKQGRFNSFLIAYKGKLLFESYYGRGRINLVHQQASATKAYTGLLLGRAIQLGYLKMEDLDQPLVNFLDELDPTKFASGAERITLNKALTMRGGIQVSRKQWNELKKNPDALKGQAKVQALLENSTPITRESQVFSYGNFNPDLVMQVVESVVPGAALDFLKNELFDKIGISNYIWRTTVSGVAEAGADAELTSRDMVKIGNLIRNEGSWNGEQLIPEAFVNKAISRILHTAEDYEIHYGGQDVSNQGYGYFWWSADLKVGDKTYFTSSAQGGWGQFIILIEELDLMVVFTGVDNDTNYLQLVAERILPAFTK